MVISPLPRLRLFAAIKKPLYFLTHGHAQRDHTKLFVVMKNVSKTVRSIETKFNAFQDCKISKKQLGKVKGGEDSIVTEDLVIG